MKIKIAFFWILNIFLLENLTSQSGYEFFPDDSIKHSFKAQEKAPRFGILYYPSNSNLKLDLGLPIEILKIDLKDEANIIIGIEASMRILSTNFKGMRFQIDALDGTLGGFITYSQIHLNNQTQVRFRFNHISSHLLDGHWDHFTDYWISQTPLPYTQNYFELSYIKNNFLRYGLIRYMGSLSYCTLVRPPEIKRLIFNLSFEYYFNLISTELQGIKITPLVSYNFEVNGNSNYKVNKSLLLGVKFGELLGKGIILYANYYSGNSPFYQYYNKSFHEAGLGFLIDY